MKNIAVYLLALTLFCYGSEATAQPKAKMKVASVKQRGKNIALVVTSPTEFYVGGNQYVLYIGDRHFEQYEHTNTDGRGRLTYLIPRADYNAIKDGAHMYLTYGDMPAEPPAEELAKDPTAKCWALGKFNRKQLSK